MSFGLRFSLTQEYRSLTIAPLNSRKCWESDFQYVLRKTAWETFPQVDYADGVDAYVVYSVVNNWGMERLKKSKPLAQRMPPLAEIERIEEEIECLHAMANDDRTPTDKRIFFKNFRLPHPQYMPECWRITGFFRKRLHILWGISKAGKNFTFLPASKNSRQWDDANIRISIRDVFLGVQTRKVKATGCFSKLFVWLWVLLIILLTLFLLKQCNESNSIERNKKSHTAIKVVKEYDFTKEHIIVSPTDGINNKLKDGIDGEPSGQLPNEEMGPNEGHDNSPNVDNGEGYGKDESHNVPGDQPHQDGFGGGGNKLKDDIDGEPSGQLPNEEMGPNEGHDNSPNVDNEEGYGKDESHNVPGDQPHQDGFGGGGNKLKDGKTLGDEEKNKDDMLRLPKRDTLQKNPRRALKFNFKVNPPRDLQGGTEDVAKVSFSITPIDDLKGKDFDVRDWRINGEVIKSGSSKTFEPPNGLRYDRAYTITASVTIEGKDQRVEPYQWNMIDTPTWQIFEFDRTKDGKSLYKLVCCNSSSIVPMVKDWKVNFRLNNGVNGNSSKSFECSYNSIGQDCLELDWGIGHYKGVYFVEVSAEFEYLVKGKIKTSKHVEVFPFAHDSSLDELTQAKYEVVIPNVYFCLSKLTTGDLINGTAFAISEKLLLSNYHVAVGGIPESYGNSGNYKVVAPVVLTNIRGKTYYAKVDWHDRGRDLAILRLCNEDGTETEDRLPGYLHLADDSLVASIKESTERYVFAVGYPKGTVLMGPPAFTDGKAERIFKRDYYYNGKKEMYDTILNYTEIECGYSGGPLIDYQTQFVLGVNFGGLMDQREGHKGASFATSATEVRRGCSRLKDANIK